MPATRSPCRTCTERALAQGQPFRSLSLQPTFASGLVHPDFVQCAHLLWAERNRISTCPHLNILRAPVASAMRDHERTVKTIFRNTNHQSSHSNRDCGQRNQRQDTETIDSFARTRDNFCCTCLAASCTKERSCSKKQRRMWCSISKSCFYRGDHAWSHAKCICTSSTYCLHMLYLISSLPVAVYRFGGPWR
jgi:hypothetical protein